MNLSLMHRRPLSALEPALFGRVCERLTRNRLPLILRHDFTGSPERASLEKKKLIRRDVEAASGFCLAILGPDGSGKSTVLAALQERIGDYFGETRQHHWRPALLPDVGALFGKKKKAGPVTDPHGKPPHSVAVSLARVAYYWLDYWLGYPWRVRKPAGQNQLVIFDRYAPDMWCDPRRYRLRAPKALLKFICRCVPQPDLTLVLLAKPEVIHQRKGEVPLATLRELLQNYQELAESGGNVRAVDCSRPVAEIADDLAALVLAKLKAKSERYHWFK